LSAEQQVPETGLRSRGALWMLLGAFAFATMGVCVKYASEHFHAAEMVFYRGLISVLLMGAVMRWRRVDWRTRYPSAHAWRSVSGVVSLTAWYYAIAALPLATAMTLNYMSSVWVGAFLIGAQLTLGRRADFQGSLMLAVLASFAGVVMILRPTLEQNQLFAGLVGLMSGLISALAYLQVTSLGRMGEPEDRTVFYFALACTLTGALSMAVLGMSTWRWDIGIWLLPMGVLATVGQWCMTRAYRQGATLVVANLQYSGIIFGAIYSLVLFGDQIPLVGWLGMLIITVSGIGATIVRGRATPAPPVQDP
jgi:S-adenosylmethionine uptake transporter